MPNKHGQGTYKGYISPVTTGWPKEIRDEVRHVYGAWRVKHPGEDQRTKSRGSRIAWAAARRKYPGLYRQHKAQKKQIERGTREEHKEHPEFSRSTAQKIATDHIIKDPTSYTHKKTLLKRVHITPAKTKAGRKQQVKDLHIAARQERAWGKSAENEKVSEGKRAKKLKKSHAPITASDTKRDSALAGNFAKDRNDLAQDYDLQAARIAAIGGN